MLKNVSNEEERSGYGAYVASMLDSFYTLVCLFVCLFICFACLESSFLSLGQSDFVSRVKNVQQQQQLQSPITNNVYEMRQQQQALLEQGMIDGICLLVILLIQR
jgi:hypothetical protein